MESNKDDDANWTHRMMSFQCKQAGINRLIVDRLIRESYREVSQKFETIARLELGAQNDTLEFRMRLKKAVRAGQVQYAMDMAKKLYPKLIESENYMYFHMQQLRLLEVIRESKLDHAVNLAKKNSPEFERTLTSISESAELFSPDILRNQQVPPDLEPKKLMFLVKLILWAQDKLESEGCIDYRRLDLDVNDFAIELEFK